MSFDSGTDAASFESICERILALVNERIADPGRPLSLESDLFDEGMDSLGLMQLLLGIEQRFGVLLDENAISPQQARTPLQIIHQLIARLH